MPDPRQELLPLTLPKLMRGRDFAVTACNRMALERIADPSGWHTPWLTITGPTGSGKTHISLIWQEMTGAEALDPLKIQSPEEIDPAAFYVLDDLPNLLKRDDQIQRKRIERGLFHLYNLMYEAGGHLLITSPTETGADFILPDLKSRYKGSEKVMITAPDEAAMSALIDKFFKEKQTVIKSSVTQFLLKRLPRSYDAVLKAVRTINQEAIRQKRAITIPFVKKVLNL